nr:uncharacterized protein LOC112211521 [Halyomorpha halys]
MEALLAGFLNRFQKLPILGGLLRKTEQENKKERMHLMPVLDLRRFRKKKPFCSTPISTIPEMNFFNECDIGEICAHEEEQPHRSSNKAPSFADFSVQKIESSFRLERLARLVRDLRLERLYEESEDWSEESDTSGFSSGGDSFSI